MCHPDNTLRGWKGVEIQLRTYTSLGLCPDCLTPWLMIIYIALFSALLSRLTALACGSTWVTSFIARFLNIHWSGVLTALAWLVLHETAAVSAQVLAWPVSKLICLGLYPDWSVLVYVQTDLSWSTSKLICLGLCPNWSVLVCVQTDLSWSVSKLICFGLCPNWSVLVCVQTDLSWSVSRLICLGLCSNWSVLVYVQTDLSWSMFKLTYTCLGVSPAVIT